MFHVINFCQIISPRFYLVFLCLRHTQNAGLQPCHPSVGLCVAWDLWLQVFQQEKSMKHRFENQLNVAEKAPMIEISKIDFHLVGPDDIVVVSFRIGLLGK